MTVMLVLDVVSKQKISGRREMQFGFCLDKMPIDFALKIPWIKSCAVLMEGMANFWYDGILK